MNLVELVVVVSLNVIASHLYMKHYNIMMVVLATCKKTVTLGLINNFIITEFLVQGPILSTYSCPKHLRPCLSISN